MFYENWVLDNFFKLYTGDSKKIGPRVSKILIWACL